VGGPRNSTKGNYFLERVDALAVVVGDALSLLCGREIHVEKSEIY